MRFVEVSKKDLIGTYKKTKNLEILDAFKSSGLEYARLEEWNYTSATSGACSLNKAIKTFKMSGIRAFSRNGQIYLVKEKTE